MALPRRRRRRGPLEGPPRAFWLLVLRGLHKERDANLSAELARLAGRSATSALPPAAARHGARRRRTAASGIDGQRRLTCDWAIDRSRPFFEALLHAAGDITGELGGELWDTAIGELERIVTVHPLGGCRMGEDASLGVVDTWGAVHGCEGLYICDGSVMPGAVGANPSLTIAAFAEREPLSASSRRPAPPRASSSTSQPPPGPSGISA